MARFMFVPLALLLSASAFAQTATATTSPLPTVSDPQAIALATKSVLAMTGGVAVSNVTLNSNVTRIAGSENETGTGTFYAKGTGESRIDLDLNGETNSEVRTTSQNTPSGHWKKGGGAVKSYAQHNCWTDAVWFFPALSSLSLTRNPNAVFSYVGLEQRSGLSLEHIRVFQRIAADTKMGILSRLSTMDFYLDPTSFLPLIIEFKLHPDNDLARDVQAEILFSDYKAVSGVNVPFHVERVINGTLDIDLVITNVALNSGLSNAIFNLQ